MQVIQVVRELNPNGGVGGVVFELKRAFDERGIENSVITLDSVLGGKPRKRNRDSKIELMRDMMVFTVLGTFAIGRARKDHPESLIINHAEPLGGDIFVDHGLHKAMVMERPRMLLNPLHIFMLVREEIRHWTRPYKIVVCLSRQGVDTLRQFFPGTRKAEVTSIPNGIALERYYPDPDKLAAHGPDQDFELVFVGHEFERKGLRLIIEALADLPKSVRLTVVGGGEAMIDREKARAAGLGVGERITFLGRRTDVPDIMRRGDLLVLPSIAEAWPLVTLEAMASGTPVLMTNVAAGQEIVGDGLGGMLIERTAADIADKVRHLVENKAEFLKLRAGAVAKAGQFPWRAIADRYLETGARVRSAAR